MVKDASRLYWDGDVLVYDVRMIRKNGREATDVVRYSLHDGGRTFVAEEKFRGPVVQYDNFWVARKRTEHLAGNLSDLPAVNRIVLASTAPERPLVDLPASAVFSLIGSRTMECLSAPVATGAEATRAAGAGPLVVTTGLK